MVDEVTNDDALDPLLVRIRRLEQRRGDLWSAAGGAGLAARVCRQVLSGERSPSKAVLSCVGSDRLDILAAYRERLAERLTTNLLARAEARAISFEIRQLRSLLMPAAYPSVGVDTDEANGP
jgi:hypothetical protein